MRSGSELAWMQEERDAIEQTARQVLDALPDATPLRGRPATYTDGLTNSLYLREAQADYARASEVLSCAVEAAYESGDAEHIAAVGRLMDQRHANQQAVTGQFMAAGRA